MLFRSVWYDSKHYTANVMRADGKVFIRGFYLFDDRIEDVYETVPCTTFDAVYENMPLVDTHYQKGDTNGGYGMILKENAEKLSAYKSDDEELTVVWDESSVIFKNDRVLLNNCNVNFTSFMVNTKISIDKDLILYEYKNHKYALKVEGAEVSLDDNVLTLAGEKITLIPTKL